MSTPRERSAVPELGADPVYDIDADAAKVRRALLNPTGSARSAEEALSRLVSAARDAGAGRQLRDDYDAARLTITRQHSLLWLVGLETHEGEEPMTDEMAVHALLGARAALARAEARHG